ncbi:MULTISPECIES: sensor domain-containing phosphodiesterase [unclassified Colwellia]|uniref:sensor domain-containing phosphodiesterase n=1 Tax=unclassified Colwellia TaxID=196834 RepID=UPI0015F3C733|nr:MULTISPECIES: EAL domain-containing protein [unclassified Colwellia]MBA6257252.1 EAL domain-containing protein [Colwellia sp. MB3u-28]MBA6258837.1 EAL domain-containing protein [Colwellia sp. MB3u-41]
MDTVRLKKLLFHQQDILSKIALGTPLNDVLHDICLSIEEIIDDKSAKCSILLLKGDQLFHCAAPNIDDKYCQLINGVYIGPNVGSCGTAAYLKSRIIVEDIETSLLWVDFKELALNFGLQSCWSTPIISTQSNILGTFAIYHSAPKTPSTKDLELIDYFVHFSSIALEKNTESLLVEQLIADLQQSNEKFKAFTKVMPDLTLILSEEGEYTDIYGSPDELLYKSLSKLIHKNVNAVMPQKDSQPIMAVIDKTLATNEVQIFEYELDVKKGSVIFEGRTAPIENYQTSNPSKRHIVWMARDITIRKNAEKEVERLAFFDSLTNLPNRRMLNERLTMCVERIKRTHKTGALLFLDLDNFKKINDSLGHSAGDELLVDLSYRLSSVIRASDTLARVGGDEFIILLEYVGDDNEQANIEAEIVAQKLQSVFKKKFEVEGLAFQMSCSIGICLVDRRNSVTDNILKFADTAMYRSKMKGGNRYSFYNPQLQTLLENQAELEADLVRAIASNEFCTYFQPQISALGKVIGAEALIRWDHPIKGLIAPNEFIPIAEQYGLMHKLQHIVLKDICVLIEQLSVENIIDDLFSVSINISHCQFNSLSLNSELLNVINDFNIRPSQIKLEITESMLSGDMESTARQMEELNKYGFIFSIDDFGTGYSRLAHLSVFPINEFKIDKSLIDKVLDDGSGLKRVNLIINLAKSLNITAIAEGVEGIEQFEILTAMHIDSIQGYMIAKPMIKNEYIEWHKLNVVSPVIDVKVNNN